MDIGDFKNYAEVIFFKKFLASVPTLSTYTEAEMDVIGIPMNVIDGENKNTYNEFVTVMITINEMIEKYSNGFPVRVINQDDVLYIYNIIQRHLEAWKMYSVNSLNQARSDVSDDLIVMDKFAHEIFDISKKRIIDSNVIKTVAYGNDFTNLLMGRAKTIPQEIDYDNASRESMAPAKERSSKYDLNSLLQ